MSEHCAWDSMVSLVVTFGSATTSTGLKATCPRNRRPGADNSFDVAAERRHGTARAAGVCAPTKHPMRSPMTMSYVDQKLVFAWQAAHSIARSSPPPVRDRGGFRVDTHSEKEVKRWVFPQLCEGLRVIAHNITAPRHYLKLCGSDEELRNALPARWELQPTNYFMEAAVMALDTKPLPNGYRMELHQAGPVTRACIIAPNGDLAASGCAAETADVFIYDR